MSAPDDTTTPARKGPARWVVLVALLSLSVFMYASIMYKIIKFGP